jgi:Tol biopolymer transport system component
MSLLDELKRRKVFRATAAYAIFAWLVVQVIVTIEEPLSLPDWTDTLVIALLAAGFPVALALSWVFDFTRDGPVRTGGDDSSALLKSTVLTGGLLFIVGFLIVAHRAATGSWIFDAPDSGMRLGEYALASDFPGSHTQPAISPDGSMIAFVDMSGPVPQIWIRNRGQGDPIRITDGILGGFAPAWSPNNDAILFHRSDGSLWSVGPLGTPAPRKLIDGGLNPDYSFDGARIVYENGRSVYIANADGSDVREVANVPRRFFESVRNQPAFSPDGNWLAVFVQETGPNGDYWVVPLDGGDARRLTFDVTQGGGPAWTPDGQYVVFPSRRGGTQTLWMVPFEGGEPLPVTTGVGEDSAPAVSRNGDLLVYSNARVEFTIVESDPETGASRDVYRSRNGIYLPQPSPDGAEFVFFAETANGVHVQAIDSANGRTVSLTNTPGELNIHPIYSADGSHVYFYRDRPERALRKVPVDGGPSVEVFPGFTWQTHMRVSEDPSGQRIAFTRMEPPDWSKDRNLVKDLATGEERVVAAPHMHSPEWSNDGQTLIGHRHNGEMAICPATGEACEVLTHAGEPVPGEQPRWSSDESRIFFRRPGSARNMHEVWVVNRDGSDAHRVLEYGPLQFLNRPFEVTADDKILWVRYDRGANEIWTAAIE